MNQRFMQQLECISEADGNGSSFGVLEEKAKDGAKYRFGEIDEAVKNRLSHEFELIRATNTAKLFLYCADIVAAIRQRTYPYVCSVQNCSLISYCLGITEVNPLLTGSHFERLLNSQSTHIPSLFIEVPKGKREEIWEYLKEADRLFIEIEENDARSDFPTEEVTAFFEKRSYEDKEILRKAATTGGPILPQTIGELADLLAYRRYAEFTDKKSSLLYQEDAVDLLVKAGLTYEEAECARRAFAKKDGLEINFYRNVFLQTARKKGYSTNEANAVFSDAERDSIFTVCRASYVAMAQYLYMEEYFKKKRDEQLCL